MLNFCAAEKTGSDVLYHRTNTLTHPGYTIVDNIGVEIIIC